MPACGIGKHEGKNSPGLPEYKEAGWRLAPYLCGSPLHVARHRRTNSADSAACRVRSTPGAQPQGHTDRDEVQREGESREREGEGDRETRTHVLWCTDPDPDASQVSRIRPLKLLNFGNK